MTWNLEPEWKFMLENSMILIFECCLCGFFLANSADNLSMHLVTCEVYICDRCNKRYKTISDLKAHYKTETIKFKKLDKVVHAKVGRTEDSEIKEGNYFKEDFCSTKNLTGLHFLV